MKYTAAFFIRKFKAIPARLWTTGEYHNTETGRRCALGHCEASKQALPLIKLFRDNGLIITWVNDDSASEKFPQKTPRGRILAALRYIKAKSC